MAHAGFEQWHGKQIFFINFRDCQDEAEELRVIADAKAKIAKCPPASVMTLTDITNAKYDDTLADAMKQLAKDNKPYVKTAAVVGVTGLRKVVFNMIIMFTRRQMSLFDDLDSARKWLAAQ
jgi:hypothetical protein